MILRNCPKIVSASFLMAAAFVLYVVVPLGKAQTPGSTAVERPQLEFF
jgi:hypothetical protein